MDRSVYIFLLSLLLFKFAPSSNAIQVGTCTECGGPTQKPCPYGMTCVDNPSDHCDPRDGNANCIGMCMFPPTPKVPPGTCVEPLENGLPGECDVCGGVANIQCEFGLLCVDDPNDDCNPQKGDSDCPGICVPPNPEPAGVCEYCFNKEGVFCSQGLVCIEDPNDNCVPIGHGGACPGICLRP